MEDEMALNVPRRYRTIPWNLSLNTKTFTPILKWLGIWSSMAVMLKLAFPLMSMMVLCEVATSTPIATNRPKPMVYKATVC